MTVRTSYSVAAWRGALAWWIERRHWRNVIRTVLALPRAVYYSARGGRRVPR